MKKKTLLIILGIVLVLVAVLFVLWLCRPKTNTVVPLNEEAADTKYPCTVTQSGENLQVDIEGGKQGYVWKVTDYGENTASAVIEKSDESGARILVKPLMSGASCLTISLQKVENPAEIESQIFLNVMVQNNTVSFVSQTRKDLAPISATNAAGEQQPFTLKPLMDGSYQVSVFGKPNAKWSVNVARGKATVTNDTPDLDEKLTEKVSVGSFTITCKGEENCLIFIKDEVHSEALKIEMKYDPAAGFSPLQTEWVTLPALSEETTPAA